MSADEAKARLLATGFLAVKVTPRASREAIEGFIADANGSLILKLKVRAVAEDGKANDAVIALLADAFGVPKSRLSIARGSTGRHKTIQYH
jgi:uncharacterized protein